MEKTLVPSSGRWENSGMGGPTECLTLRTSESHSGAVVSSLSDILETGDLPQRYYLSKRACAGLLARAKKREKILPARLKAALEAVALQPVVLEATKTEQERAEQRVEI